MEAINKYPQLVKDFIEVSHRLRQRELTLGGGGGISMLIPGSKKVLIKGWEVASEDAGKKDIALVDLGGHQRNRVKPCLETPLHLEVLKTREDIQAVIHAHSPYLTAFGNVKPELDEGALKNYSLLKPTVLTPYADPGSRELAQTVARPFQNPEVICVLMEDHGVTVVGTDIFNAYYRLDILEGMAKTFVLTQLLRKAIKR